MVPPNDIEIVGEVTSSYQSARLKSSAMKTTAININYQKKIYIRLNTQKYTLSRGYVPSFLFI
jgi:hypothetical protein